MKALSLDEVCDRIVSFRNPLILMHCRPDGDTVGSAAALAHLFSALGRSAALLCSDPIGHRLEFLLDGLDTTAPDLSRKYDVITVDVASPQQLGALEEVFVGCLAPSLMIDHHDKGVSFADFYTRPEAAAVGEILFDIASRMVERGMLDSFPASAVNTVFAAISSDTGCFKYSNATAYTHTVAAKLITLGAAAADINHRLFDVKSAEMLRAEGYVQSHLCVHPSGRIAWIGISSATRDGLGLADEHFETAIDIVRSLEGVEVAIAAKENSPGCFKVSFRSIGLDVCAIATALGGGGHIRAAGCTVAAETAETAIAPVLEKVAAAMGL